MTETKPRVLILSTNYPSRATPLFGTFVRSRVRALQEYFEVQVICPVPYLPGIGMLPRYAHRRHVPPRETRDGIETFYPRFPFVPRFGGPLQAWSLYQRLAPLLRSLRRRFPFDCILAQFAYPEGAAAARLARSLDVPFAVAVLGHDLHLLPERRLVRAQIRHALTRAGRVLAVSSELAALARALGAPADRVRVVPNGVDADLFRPMEAGACRKALGLPLTGPIILGVGRLSEEKRWPALIEALAALRARRPDDPPALVIVGGEGDALGNRAEIDRTIRRLGLQNAVRLAGAQPQETLPLWYGAADVLCLASSRPTSREGCPNVVLESLACGTPVVATDVGDLREIVERRDVGVISDDDSARGLGESLDRALSRRWDRERIAALGRQRTWREVGSEIAAELRAILNGDASRNDGPAGSSR